MYVVYIKLGIYYVYGCTFVLRLDYVVLCCTFYVSYCKFYVSSCTYLRPTYVLYLIFDFIIKDTNDFRIKNKDLKS